ncbi:regulator of volume decrease after cellular swelling-domain-containing protein [Cladochytrium replicatum]|nr:regulator of volume decrease after cellular swelling-domain-containing protein [Cladochytrium replicatum]
MAIHILNELPFFHRVVDGQPQGNPDPASIKFSVNSRILVDPPLSGQFGDIDLNGEGELYVAESQLVWFSPATAVGIAVDYLSIVAYGAASEDRLAAGPCVYCQVLAGGSGITQESDVVSSDNEDAMDEEEIPTEERFWEVRIVPTQLDIVYQIVENMNLCSSLHPDPDMENDEAPAGDGGWMFSADDIELDEAGQAALEHLEQVFESPLRPIETETNGMNGIKRTASDAELEDSNPRANHSNQQNQFEDAEE